VLSLSDGLHDLLAIANQSSLPYSTILTAATTLERHGLLLALP
jgi:aminopeptidase-like protein